MLVLLYVGMSILNVCVEEEVLFFDGFDEYTWTASPTATVSYSRVACDVGGMENLNYWKIRYFSVKNWKSVVNRNVSTEA